MENRHPPKNPIVLIPARMASTRLPGKPLADIHGEPMIVHVWRRAMESEIGPVVVACDGPEIAKAIEKVGGRAILTKPDHPRGSDRIWEALSKLEGGDQYDAIVNIQGDVPTIEPSAILATYNLLNMPEVDISTVGVEIDNEQDKLANQIVKAAIDVRKGDAHGRALYFSRLPIPSGSGPMYHHVGIYAYKRSALARFAAGASSPLEERESLEQLRALSLGMRIEAAILDTVPLGVDTPADLEKARELLRKK
jgi:3-deoxy-manno-octulosonate cytidylyltransferase (CMP-KDO synthetase)